MNVSGGFCATGLINAGTLIIRLGGDCVAEEIGGDTVVVDALPALFGPVSAARLLPDLVAELEAAGPRADRMRWSEERVAQAACKGAVKQRDRLTLAEIEQLVQDLALTEMPYTCPHGRPTLIGFSFDELHRRFGRV